MSSSKYEENAVIGGKFIFKQRIGSGYFGEIFMGQNLVTKEDVAIKIEKTNENKESQLVNEYNIYGMLHCGFGIPAIHSLLTHENGSHLMVMQLLGPSVEKLFQMQHHHFSMKSILMLTIQIIDRLEFIHSKNFIHCDIKPANILIGRGVTENIIYLTDFGLSKQYRHAVTNAHLPFKEHINFRGTLRYASLNAHRCWELSRRDDLESFAYMLIYLCKGKLPWQYCFPTKGSVADKSRAVYEIKLSVSVEQLCADLPKEFAIFLNYVRNLSFDQEPDYEYMRKLFLGLFLTKEYTFDFIYDWTKPSSEISK